MNIEEISKVDLLLICLLVWFSWKVLPYAFSVLLAVFMAALSVFTVSVIATVLGFLIVVNALSGWWKSRKS